MSLKCSCPYCISTSSDNNPYHVDFSSFTKKRPVGVSGILRVKNDAEFLAESIDSCIEALDELIIVYNGCTDESPQIIREKAKQYGEKIRYYEYVPVVYATNLMEEEYQFVKSLSDDSPHLLANYCNYALSKVTYKYVVKIDADQIYMREELKTLCDAYRARGWRFITPRELICFCLFYLEILVGKKMYKSLGLGGKRIADNYRRCLLKLIANHKLPVFLSGVNVFCFQDKWNVTLGRQCHQGINILPPYNGVGDTIIFALSSGTYFVPFELKAYAELNAHKMSVIEIFRGVKFSLPFGFVWMHLNAMRRNIYAEQVKKIGEFPDNFLSIEVFVKTPFSEINCTKNERILSRANYFLFRLFHNTFLKQSFQDFVCAYRLSGKEMFTLKKEK
ncbi:MAG: hypothetical protein RSA53_09485 [Odoribacter sp.]